MKALEKKKEEEEELLWMLEPMEDIKFRKIIKEGRKVSERITLVPFHEEKNSKGELNQDEFFLQQAILEVKEMQASLDSLNQRMKKVDACAPGSPRHLSLLRCYLDLMEEKDTKGLEANLEVCLRAIDT
jgi:hypothetical protein